MISLEELTEEERAEWHAHSFTTTKYILERYGEGETITRFFKSTHRVVRIYVEGGELKISELRRYKYFP